MYTVHLKRWKYPCTQANVSISATIVEYLLTGNYWASYKVWMSEMRNYLTCSQQWQVATRTTTTTTTTSYHVGIAFLTMISRRTIYCIPSLTSPSLHSVETNRHCATYYTQQLIQLSSQLNCQTAAGLWQLTSVMIISRLSKVNNEAETSGECSRKQNSLSLATMLIKCWYNLWNVFLEAHV